MGLLGSTIENPLVKISPNGYGDLGSGGLINFVSNLVKTLMIGAGIYAFINLVIAGFSYLSAGGDSKKITQAWSQIYMSLIGLVVMVSSYALATLVSWLLFGDPSAILSPRVYGPGN